MRISRLNKQHIKAIEEWLHLPGRERSCPFEKFKRRRRNYLICGDSVYYICKDLFPENNFHSEAMCPCGNLGLEYVQERAEQVVARVKGE